MLIVEKKKGPQVMRTSSAVRASLTLGRATGRAPEELTLLMCAAHVFWGYFGVFKMSVGCFLVKALTASGFVKESAFYEEIKKGKIIILAQLSSLWHSVCAMYRCCSRQEGPPNILLSSGTR